MFGTVAFIYLSGVWFLIDLLPIVNCRHLTTSVLNVVFLMWHMFWIMLHRFAQIGKGASKDQEAGSGGKGSARSRNREAAPRHVPVAGDSWSRPLTRNKCQDGKTTNTIQLPPGTMNNLIA